MRIITSPGKFIMSVALEKVGKKNRVKTHAKRDKKKRIVIRKKERDDSLKYYLLECYYYVLEGGDPA